LTNVRNYDTLYSNRELSDDGSPLDPGGLVLRTRYLKREQTRQVRTWLKGWLKPPVEFRGAYQMDLPPVERAQHVITQVMNDACQAELPLAKEQTPEVPHSAFGPRPERPPEAESWMGLVHRR
jgi:hypothetical protein